MKTDITTKRAKMKKVTECEGKYTYDGDNYYLYFESKDIKIFIDDDRGKALICKNDLEIIALISSWTSENVAFLNVSEKWKSIQ